MPHQQDSEMWTRLTNIPPKWTMGHLSSKHVPLCICCWEVLTLTLPALVFHLLFGPGFNFYDKLPYSVYLYVLLHSSWEKQGAGEFLSCPSRTLCVTSVSTLF